jgi:hypothetical protein
VVARQPCDPILPAQNVGQWLCVPPFRMVCLDQALLCDASGDDTLSKSCASCGRPVDGGRHEGRGHAWTALRPARRGGEAPGEAPRWPGTNLPTAPQLPSAHRPMAWPWAPHLWHARVHPRRRGHDAAEPWEEAWSDGRDPGSCAGRPPAPWAHRARSRRRRAGPPLLPRLCHAGRLGRVGRQHQTRLAARMAAAAAPRVASDSSALEGHRAGGSRLTGLVAVSAACQAGLAPVFAINAGGISRPVRAQAFQPLKRFVPQPGTRWCGRGTAFQQAGRQPECTRLAM